MLTTAAEARNRVCLMDMVNSRNAIDAGCCRGEECSAWRWEAATGRAVGAERLGFCGMIGCVERTVRKHPRRLVESTVFPAWGKQVSGGPGSGGRSSGPPGGRPHRPEPFQQG